MHDLTSSLKQHNGSDGELEEIWLRALCSAVRRDDPLASAFGSVAGRRGRAAFTLGLGGLGLSLRRTGVSHQLPQELKLRQEELPHHVPPEEHEEEDTYQRGHDHQHGQTNTLPHPPLLQDVHASVFRPNLAGRRPVAHVMESLKCSPYLHHCAVNREKKRARKRRTRASTTRSISG